MSLPIICLTIAPTSSGVSSAVLTTRPLRITVTTSASCTTSSSSMGDVEDSRVGEAHAPEQGVEMLNLAHAKRRRRLVEYEDAGVGRNSLGDLNELLLSLRQIADTDIGRNFNAEIAQHLLGRFAQSAPVDPEWPAWPTPSSECSRPR